MITVDASKCSGCRRCEVVCSFAHSGKVGRSSARIKAVKIEGQGIDMPVVCQQCLERYCTKCPEGAITVGPLGQIIVSPTLCTACGACERQCPIGAIELYNDIPYVCDLCGGAPRCVQACNLRALSFLPDAVGIVSLADARKHSRGLPTEAKRVLHAERAAASLREQWLARRQA